MKAHGFSPATVPASNITPNATRTTPPMMPPRIVPTPISPLSSHSPRTRRRGAHYRVPPLRRIAGRCGETMAARRGGRLLRAVAGEGHMQPGPALQARAELKRAAEEGHPLADAG